MNVNTILHVKGREVISVSPETPILKLTKIFTKNKIGSIVVLDNERLVGIVSERDVVRAIASHGPEVLGETVSSIMTSEVITCGGGDTIDQIMSIMTTGRFRHIPVIENGQLSGIISIGDVVQQRIAAVEMEAKAMRSYIATG
ncbi:MAG: inosine-5-monophosphate dehydrogenase [Rhodomicrobium sp.]|nr:MAG: inosine-5-monophosphate dehydrogenase [Rhodomicrobium sp.]